MVNLNRVVLIGNLVKDPELRHIANGKAVVNLRLAINRKFKDRNGEIKEDVCFVGVTVWDRQAEACSKYLQKGRSLFIEGTLQSRSWEKDGQKHNTLEVRAERIQFLDGAKTQEGEQKVKENHNPDNVVDPADIAWEE